MPTLSPEQISPEQLLGREPIEVNLEPARLMLAGKSVLVTGAAGSIGSELARRLASLNDVGRLCLVDRAETPLHNLHLELTNRTDANSSACVIGDVTDPAAMQRLFRRFKPDVVFHAAAYKHVPMMEEFPHAAIVNNLGPTCLLADLAVKSGTECFVLVSTDKAVNPTNIMGASKRAAEIYVQSLGSEPSPTRFITTRFGNVLASQGSVVPLFQQQLRCGGPLTVTHPEVRRFFMLISEACRLVLLAAALGKGGEIFAFDMGASVRIADLARRMIALGGSGAEQIVYTGLRPGEKLYEEVLTSDETTLPGPHPKIKIARVRPAKHALVLPLITDLLNCARSPVSTPMDVAAALKKLVPEFRSRNSPFCVLDS